MIRMFEDYISSRSISMGLKLNELFITDPTSLKGKDLDSYFKLKFKIGDLVVLTKGYFDKTYVYNEEEPMDLDDRLEDNNSIFRVEFISIKNDNEDEVEDSYYIRNIRDKSQKLITNNVAWVNEQEIELCPQWRLDAQNYNL